MLSCVLLVDWVLVVLIGICIVLVRCVVVLFGVVVIIVMWNSMFVVSGGVVGVGVVLGVVCVFEEWCEGVGDLDGCGE